MRKQLSSNFQFQITMFLSCPTSSAAHPCMLGIKVPVSDFTTKKLPGLPSDELRYIATCRDFRGVKIA